MNRPHNLTRLAARDLIAILDRSAQLFGEEQAQRLEERILHRCRRIAEGESLGHARADVTNRRVTRFVTMSPIVIAYNPDTRLVIRILDGRRDLGRLFR